MLAAPQFVVQVHLICVSHTVLGISDVRTSINTAGFDFSILLGPLFLIDNHGSKCNKALCPGVFCSNVLFHRRILCMPK